MLSQTATALAQIRPTSGTREIHCVCMRMCYIFTKITKSYSITVLKLEMK